MNWQPIKTIPKDRVVVVAEEYDAGKWGYDLAWFEPLFGLYITDSHGPDHFYALSDNYEYWSDIQPPRFNEPATTSQSAAKGQ